MTITIMTRFDRSVGPANHRGNHGLAPQNDLGGVAIIAAFSVSAFGALSAPATADETVTDNVVQGIQPLPEGYSRLADTPEIKAQSAVTDAKYRVFELWAAKAELERVSAPSSKLIAVDKQIAVAQDRVESIAGEPILPANTAEVAALSGGPVGPAAFPTPAAARTLSLRHSAQSNGYYCGPATTAMVIRMSGGPEVSRYNSSHTMSQTRLASSTYLGTTTSGTSIHRIPVALKRWMNLNTNVYAGPTATKLKSLVTGSISVLSHGVAYGTREYGNGAHYNGHPGSRSIDHFIAGHGYTEHGVHLKYADPATSVWAGVKRTNNMRAYKMRDFIAPWGVVA